MERMNPLIKKIEELAQQVPVSAMYVFGSRVAEIKSLMEGKRPGRRLSGSDMDIGVQPETGERLTAKNRVDLTLALERILSVKRVDLVVLPEANPFLALEIIRGELIYCRDHDQQAEDELYILRRAGDLAYFEKERRRMIIEEGAR
jgi:uncharacterized protein